MEKIYYKKTEISLIKTDKNYIPPSIPLITKKCSCGGMLEMRPIGIPWIKTDKGYYLVMRCSNGKLYIKNEMVTDFLYACNKCHLAEITRIKRPNEIIEIVD